MLCGEHVHLRAEDVHERARARDAKISLATVYNTLHELVAMGEVREVGVGGAGRRFEANVDTPHQHLVCTKCGLLRDVDLAPVEPPGANERHGFSLTGVRVVFEGLCPRCAEAGSTRISGP